MPHVLLLSSEFPPGPGGIGTHAHQLAVQLHQRGWTVTVATQQELADEVAIRAFNQQQPFPIHTLKQFGPAPVKLAYRLAVASALIRRRRPDLIVASGERMVWLAAALRSVHRIPLVAIGHAMEFNVPSRWQRAATRRSFEAATAVVCVSEYTRGQMERSGIRPRISEVIPNGADESRFRLLPTSEGLAFRRARGIPDDAHVLITVGSVHERKGQDVMIRALPRVVEKFHDVRYVMAGVPYRRDAFMALAAKLGVSEHVQFLGVVDAGEIVRALNAANMFVMTSQHTPNGDFEGFGIAVVEAALCGIPAVVSDGSGVVEAIEDGETGLVARISDPSSTADRVIELLGDRTRLFNMGQLARERALHSKTWTRRGAQYDELFRRILDGTASTSAP